MTTEFEEAFHSLAGFSPMQWQRRLFERFVANDVPTTCDLPTGLGKTSVLTLWLLALVKQAQLGDVRLPRRLIYIVNRRTVVDQATETVERMRRRLLHPESPDWQGHAHTLQTIAGTLRELSATETVPLAISTLRGEFADNEEWKTDPARPAIVIGTIDMVGSKLLFSGYGDRPYGRAHHAGLAGHDALIVHDEAHLTPTFSDLLRAISHEQAREAKRNDGLVAIAHPIRVIELSATSRGGDASVFALEEEDRRDELVSVRLAAEKRLHIHHAAGDSVVDRIVELSKAHEAANAKVLIYARSPERAQRVATTLAQSLAGDSRERIALLTGTIRGHERDRLVETNPVYLALLDHEYRPESTVYLVSTSAGEVGIDLDADHLVCDLTTLDALIQRLGRVNRRGGAERRARVDVVGEQPATNNPSEVDKAIASTLRLLQEWTEGTRDGLDVGPASLRRRLSAATPEAIEAAFSPRPEAPTLTDILLDAWSLSSVQTMPRRPEVAQFLHGLTRDLPETLVAWRSEIRLLAKAEVDEERLSDWFRACRIEARERLRDRTDRVKKTLETLLKGHRKRDGGADFNVVLLNERGEARWSKLSEITGSDFSLEFRTVVLPLEVVGIDSNGMIDSKILEAADGFALDVAEEGSTDERRERWMHRRSIDVHGYERLLTGERLEALPDVLREKARIRLVQSEEGEDDPECLDLVLIVSPKRSALEDPETTSARQALHTHTEAIVNGMTVIAQKLGVPPAIGAALITAARWHDRGKDRPVWQRYARNDDALKPLAKSPQYLHPRALGGYRHEFGSLLEATGDAELGTDAERDLVLHLIAAHHGWARPHFEPRSYDTTRTSSENHQAASEVMRRFGRLQERFGRWGLAWLESLLRCADMAASRQAAKTATIRQPQDLGS